MAERRRPAMFGVYTQIRRLRLLRGWSQDTLAERSEVTRNTIRLIESGSDASPATLRKLATGLSVEVSDLLTSDYAIADRVNTPAEHIASDVASA
jgi:transcriptional regulator with XRE-family HTH domain